MNETDEALRRLGGNTGDQARPDHTALGLLESICGQSPEDLKARCLLGEVRDLIAFIGLATGRDVRAFDQLRTAGADLRAVLASAPAVKHFRLALIDHDEVVLRAAKLVFDGDPSVQRAGEKDDRAWLCQIDGLVLIAREMARCAAMEGERTMPVSPAGNEIQKRCFAQAAAALELAGGAGLPLKSLGSDPQLGPLRGDAGFKRLLENPTRQPAHESKTEDILR